jgi:hypothetical protein
MLYTAKCYWPGLDPRRLEEIAATRAAEPSVRREDGATYRGSLLFPNDELVLSLFESTSRAGATAAAEQAGIPCERIIESVWFPPSGGQAAGRSPLARWLRAIGRRRSPPPHTCLMSNTS